MEKKSNECVRLKSTDIQPDIFSYLLHLMYTGKMAPQLIDPVRLEQGIKFLHAFPLIQEASLASHGGFSHADQVFPLASSLYGIQIADHQIRPPAKVTTASEKNNRETRPQTTRINQDTLSDNVQLPSSLPAANRTNLTFSETAQAPMSPEPTSSVLPTASTLEENSMEDSPSEEQNSSLTIAHVKPSIMKRNGSFPKQKPAFPLLSVTMDRKLKKESMEAAEAGIISDSDMPQISDSPIIDGQQQAETPPPSDIADIDNLEQADQEREVKRRKYECTICGRKFIQKSHWREHMYIHTGKPFKCSTCDKSFCRANQAARHVCLKSSDTYTVVDKQTLELCSFDESSQMDNMLVQTNKRYKCNLCDKTFSTPNEVVKHTCQGQNSDVFALEDEGKSILLSSGDSEAAESEHSMLTSIKKEQETVLD
ncbi:unnamed protein product [Ranitomeya imitator]|uniref:C2H2-type domain-containing protein n=1 Tax=Ranitomeya imitator TaxID=111125 RepID=A0ABN9LJF2_9NEOB|nr:unnamed protein product [Ranitomeya imitator]